MADEGNNGSGGDQGSNSQGAGDQNNQGGAGSGGGEGNNNQSADTVSREEYDKAKTATMEILKKKDHYKGEFEKAQSLLEEAQKKAAENTVDPEEQKQKYLDIIADKDKKLADTMNRWEREKVSSSVKSIASKLKAVDADQILKIVKDDILIDKGGRAVINDGKGEADINKETGKAITIEEHVTALLTKYPNLVQSSGNSGSGGSSGRSGGTGDYTPEQIAEISKNPVEWAKHKHKIQAQAERAQGLKPRLRIG